MPGPRAEVAALLQKELPDLPLGPVLTALLQTVPQSEMLLMSGDEVGEDAFAWERDTHGLLLFARAPNGHFGPIASRLGKTIDTSLIGYADRQGLDPEVGGRDLASFLGVLAFCPDFFTLHGKTAAEWDGAHADFVASANARTRKAVKAILAIPGVPTLTRGADVVALLSRAPRHAFEPTEGSSAAFEAFAMKLFDARIGHSNLLAQIESLSVDGRTATIVIGLNCPRELGERLIAHPVLKDPLRGFLRDVREAHPDRDVQLKFLCVPLGDESLAIALREAGVPDLLTALRRG